MHKKTIALALTNETSFKIWSARFERQFRIELGILDEEGFFSGSNWTYTSEDILSLWDRLPFDLRKECIEMYPRVIERVRQTLSYLRRFVIGHDSELVDFLERIYGQGSSESIDRDMAIKIAAISTAVARYYIFFLLAMNSDDTKFSPRVIMDNVSSFRDFFKRLHGFPLFEDLKYLHIKGNVEIGRMVTFRNAVEIFLDRRVGFCLVGESTLDNIRLVINESGKVIEERI